MTPPRFPHFIERRSVASAIADRNEIKTSLSKDVAEISPKYFYDKLGSYLFEAITELPEYYPTRAEASIFEAYGADIAARAGTGATLIDLGAGNCEKACKLFPLLEPSRYVAIDISAEFLHDSLHRVQRLYPTLEIVGLGQDFSASLDLDQGVLGARPVFFYPGSSIGNLTPLQALEFLKRVRGQADGGGILIGIDLVKPKAILEAAYADAIGVTAAFNLNVLRLVNRMIGSDFDATEWQHVAVYDESEARVEMHLEARRDLDVQWADGSRHFRKGERIHTENSYKYSLESFTQLLLAAGFAAPDAWTDSRDWYGVFWAQAR